MERLAAQARIPAGGTGYALALALLLGVAACAESPAEPVAGPPIVVLGVDGLEWSVLGPLLEKGELPALARMLETGSGGPLVSLEPTLSPVIWTSIATGKTPQKHGILHFVKPGEEARLYTNRDRRTKAVWNLYSEAGLRVHTIGWWMTFPAEPVEGVMVAQTNTPSQLDTRAGRAIWKGSLLPGLGGQVHPESLQARVLAVADSVVASLDAELAAIYGTFPHPLDRLGTRLWENTRWSMRADLVYEAIARDLLDRGPAPDLLLLYLGSPDVVGHRFWRYAYPDEYLHPPSPEERENFGTILFDTYRRVDRVVGLLQDRLPGATLIVVSDHGMVVENRDREFDPDEPPEDVNSGHHHRGEPGVFLASGPRIRPLGLRLDEPVGTVLDITPTLLALRGLPVGEDMDGDVLRDRIDPAFLAAHPVRRVPTHDTAAWLASRPERLLVPVVEEERKEQLRSLGYIQ